LGEEERLMAYRKAHGNAAKGGETLTWETPPSDEQRTAPDGVAAPIERRGNGTFTADGARAAARRRAALQDRPDFADQELSFIPAEAFQPFEGARRGLLAGAGGEVFEATGGVSRRVWAILRGAAWLTSFGEYWATEAAKSGSGDAADRAARLLSKASVEYQKAWDAACVEAEARRGSASGNSVEQLKRKVLAAAGGGT
jgi:hypothetical protein